jgi:L-iditol 2-dehydrogenase
MGGGCGLPTGFHAVERAGIALGDTVVVQGSGPVGLNAAIFAQLAGALRVVMIGAPRARLEAARRLGVDETIDLTQASDAADRIAAVRTLTDGRGADVVIEASGNPAAVPEGLEILRDAGRYVIVGQYTDGGDVALNPHRHLNRKHATVLGCWGYEYTHLHRSVALMARHRDRFRWRELITRRYSLDEANEALRDMERLAVVKAVIEP